jgi:hypothetical protein
MHLRGNSHSHCIVNANTKVIKTGLLAHTIGMTLPSSIQGHCLTLKKRVLKFFEKSETID